MNTRSPQETVNGGHLLSRTVVPRVDGHTYAAVVLVEQRLHGGYEWAVWDECRDPELNNGKPYYHRGDYSFTFDNAWDNYIDRVAQHTTPYNG